MNEENGGDTLAGDSGPTALDNTGTANAIAGVVARQNDAGASATVGYEGGGRSGITGSGGLPASSGQPGGAEPTNVDAEEGMGEIGAGTGGAGSGTLGDLGRVAETLAGTAGTGVGGTGTEGGATVGTRSGGTGDIGGLGGSAVDTPSADGGIGTAAIGGVAGGIGTTDEGDLGTAAADRRRNIDNSGEEPE